MKLPVIVCCFISLTACIKEKTTSYVVSIKNNSTHQVEIKPYSNGVIVSNNIILLLPTKEIQIAQGSDRGINGNSGFSSKYFAGSDSLRVTFDNLYTITHYLNAPGSYSNKYYLYSSYRNLLNYMSFAYLAKDISKYRRENTYVYEFKEQDCLDSK